MYECIVLFLGYYPHDYTAYNKHTRVHVLEIDLKVGAKIDKTSKHNYFVYLKSGCIQVIEMDEFEFSLGRQYNRLVVFTNHK